MKKIFLLILFILGFVNICLSTPNNSMTSQYDPNPNQVISSSSYKNQENNQITTYNAHSHTDITQTGTITSGIWQGTAIDETYGGVGSNFSSTAQGNIFYFSGTGTVATLSPGTAGYYLKTQGTGANPTWGTFAIGNFTRDLTAESGTQAITGVGFKPTVVIFFAMLSSTTSSSNGMDNGTTQQCVITDEANSNTSSTTVSIRVGSGVNIYQTGEIVSLDSDGFTLTWTKTGSPTGTATIDYIAY